MLLEGRTISPVLSIHEHNLCLFSGWWWVLCFTHQRQELLRLQCVEPRLPGQGYICSHAPRTWMWYRDFTAFEMERFRASPSLAVKYMLYSDFFPLKPLFVMPVACLFPAESSLSHQFKFWRHLCHLRIGHCLLGEWNLAGRRASQLCTGHRYLGILVACGTSPDFSCRSVEGLKVLKVILVERKGYGAYILHPYSYCANQGTRL